MSALARGGESRPITGPTFARRWSPAAATATMSPRRIRLPIGHRLNPPQRVFLVGGVERGDLPRDRRFTASDLASAARGRTSRIVESRHLARFSFIRSAALAVDAGYRHA